jgi:hypothetical protein
MARETMKDIPDDILATVRDRLVTGRSVPYDSLGDKLVLGGTLKAVRK